MHRGARGNGGESNARIAVNAALEAGEESVVGAAMSAAKGTERVKRRLALVVRELPQAVEDGVDDDDVRVQAVDARGENEVKLKMMEERK